MGPGNKATAYRVHRIYQHSEHCCTDNVRCWANLWSGCGCVPLPQPGQSPAWRWTQERGRPPSLTAAGQLWSSLWGPEQLNWDHPWYFLHSLQPVVDVVQALLRRRLRWGRWLCGCGVPHGCVVLYGSQKTDRWASIHKRKRLNTIKWINTTEGFYTCCFHDNILYICIHASSMVCEYTTQTMASWYEHIARPWTQSVKDHNPMKLTRTVNKHTTHTLFTVAIVHGAHSLHTWINFVRVG